MPTPRASEREAMPCGRLHPHAAHVEAGLLPCPGVPAPDDLREQIARALHVDNVKRPEMHVDCEPAPSEARAAATVMDVLRRNGVIRQ